MLQFSEDFAGRVRWYLAHYGASPNSIEQRSERRISHMTVRRMLKGYPPSSDHIIEFADAVGRTDDEKADVANDLLKRAEKRVVYAPHRVIFGAGLRIEAFAPA